MMRAAINDPRKSKRELIMVNYCRVYLCVVTIAELANEQGNFIPGNRMNG